MDRGFLKHRGADKRQTDRIRLVTLCTGLLGLLVTVFVCGMYTYIGRATLAMYGEVCVYGALLSAMAICAYRRFYVREVLQVSLLAMFAIYWGSAFFEAHTGVATPIDYPVALFVPLFLVILLNYRATFILAPIQFACIYIYTSEFFVGSMTLDWGQSDEHIFSLMIAVFSGFSFCALGVVSFTRELSDRKLFETMAETELLASTDGLTGLRNRRAFLDELRRVWPVSERVRIAFIDLDHFKPLNDQYGHAVGDHVLRVIAQRIKDVPNVQASARLGGDEFAVLFDESTEREVIDQIIQNLHEKITADIKCDARLVTIGASIGYAEGETLKQTLSGLLRSADTAMRRAKGSGLSWVRFNPRIDNAALTTSTLEMELKTAIQNGQIKAALQPIADAKTRKVVAHELLARWTDSGFDRDPSPKDFIPIAEKLGLLNEVLWVTLEEALAHLDLTTQRLAINVSPAQLLAGDFLETLMSILDRHSVSPTAITLEVTEEVAFRNVARNVAVLQQARDFGMTIALDDFGTGYSSLSMLDTLPLDKLKIDQSFVRKSDQSAHSKSILLAAIRLAKQLGLESCVEGIETQKFAARVAVLGADHIQGYWIGKPELIQDRVRSLRLAS
ncbi:MAG: EAL domain-containing protein [Pseudomonadota bacterium]